MGDMVMMDGMMSWDERGGEELGREVK